MTPKPKSTKTVFPEGTSPGAEGPLYLPGDKRPAEEVERMIRVDHAGEYGAVRIYAGQLAVLGNRPTGDAIRAMAEQEAKHLKRFNEILPARRVRPTALAPLWHVAGYALGFGTALLGEHAAMACTVAVEDVIDTHYAEQAAHLGNEEADLKATIEEFRADELEHRQTALDHDAENEPAYPILTGAIKTASRMAIWLSKRI
jgi:ubiquinone biosynthesis monooxygenase Coq7